MRMRFTQEYVWRSAGSLQRSGFREKPTYFSLQRSSFRENPTTTLFFDKSSLNSQSPFNQRGNHFFPPCSFAWMLLHFAACQGPCLICQLRFKTFLDFFQLMFLCICHCTTELSSALKFCRRANPNFWTQDHLSLYLNPAIVCLIQTLGFPKTCVYPVFQGL